MRLTARIANAIRGVLPSPRIVSQSKFRRGSRVRVVDGRLEVGSGVTILRNGEFQGKVSIGDGTFINRDAYIRDGTRIGCFVSIGPFVRIITDGHEIGESGRRAGKSFGSPVVVGDGAWIGACVVILGGVSVGRGSVVAAGSVVIRDVPANTLVAGVPARVVRELDS